MSNLSWRYEEGIYSLEELCYKFPPPVLVQCDIENSELPRDSSAMFDLSQPILIYRQRNINKVTAHDVQREYYKEAGPPLLIPEDYKGWFAVLQKKQRNPLTIKHDVSEFKLIADLSNSNTETFLIGGTEHVQALQVTHFSEGQYQHQPRSLFPGEVLRKGKIYVGETRRKSGIFRRPKIKQEYYLLCIDEYDREILLPFTQKGEFFAITTESGRMSCPVLHMKDILDRRYLPATVKLLFGRMPSHACHFTGTLRLEHSHFERSVIACTTSERNYFVELPISCTLKFKIFEMNEQVISSGMYKRAFAMCNEKANLYMRNIKACQEVGVPTILSNEDFDDEIPPSPHILRKRNPSGNPTEDNRESGYIEMRDSLEITDDQLYIDMKDTQSLTSDLALDDDEYVLPTGRTFYDSLRRTASGNYYKHSSISRQRSFRSPPPSGLPPPLPVACVGPSNRTYLDLESDSIDETHSKSSKTSDRIRKIQSERIYDIPRIPKRLSAPDITHACNTDSEGDAIKYENFSILREVVSKVPKPCRNSSNSPHRRIAEPVEYDLLPSNKDKSTEHALVHEPTNKCLNKAIETEHVLIHKPVYNDPPGELPTPCENDVLLQEYENIETHKTSELSINASDDNTHVHKCLEQNDPNDSLYVTKIQRDMNNLSGETEKYCSSDILEKYGTEVDRNMTNDINISEKCTAFQEDKSSKNIDEYERNSTTNINENDEIVVASQEQDSLLEMCTSGHIETNAKEVIHTSYIENKDSVPNENGKDTEYKNIEIDLEIDDISNKIKRNDSSTNINSLESQISTSSSVNSLEEYQLPPACKNTHTVGVLVYEPMTIENNSCSPELNNIAETNNDLDNSNILLEEDSMNEIKHDSCQSVIFSTEMNVLENDSDVFQDESTICSTTEASKPDNEEMFQSSDISINDTEKLESRNNIGWSMKTETLADNSEQEDRLDSSGHEDFNCDMKMSDTLNLSDTYVEIADIEHGKREFISDTEECIQGESTEIMENNVSCSKLMAEVRFANEASVEKLKKGEDENMQSKDNENDNFQNDTYIKDLAPIETTAESSFLGQSIKSYSDNKMSESNGEKYTSTNSYDKISENMPNYQTNTIESVNISVQEIKKGESGKESSSKDEEVENQTDNNTLKKMTTDEIVEGFKKLGIRKSVIEQVQTRNLEGSDLNCVENLNNIFPGISCIDKRKISMFLQGMMQTSNSSQRRDSQDPVWV